VRNLPKATTKRKKHNKNDTGLRKKALRKFTGMALRNEIDVTKANRNN